MPASYYIGKVQECLVFHGAAGIKTMYDDEKRISSITFGLKHKSSIISFTIPCEWRKTQKVLQEQGVTRGDDDDFAYRVAWANIMDWVLAQMAFYQTNKVEIPQLLLAFVQDGNGNTLYEMLEQRHFLLGDGK